MNCNVLMEIRFPSIDNAIKFLRPGAKYDYFQNEFLSWNCPNGSNPPTREEIIKQVEKDIEVYNYYLYAINRQNSYGDVRDQLDMIYHDIESGNLENGSWMTMMRSVKKLYPKPEGQPPN